MLQFLYPYLWIFLFQPNTLDEFHAIYKVKRVATPSIQQVEVTGHLYKSGNRYIYFERPDYLKIYPDGKVPLEPIGYRQLPLDTMQSIWATDLDSLRYRFNYLPAQPGNYTYTFVSNLEHHWEFHPKKRSIQGLECQFATLSNLYGHPVWEVWFCPAIPVKAGVFGLMGLPGLVVEAQNLQNRANYVLKSYSLQDTFNKEIFWPAIFNAPFEVLPHRTANPKPGSVEEPAALKKLRIGNEASAGDK
jgi:hypothetical protein